MRVGIFGGSFNPPHSEHIAICKHALAELGLDYVVIVPCGNAPHKFNLVPFADRLEMLKLTIADEKKIIVDTLENELDGITNSARILPLLSRKYSQIVFIIGGDSLENMKSWIQPQVVMSFPIAVIPRKAVTPKLIATADLYRSTQNSDITFLSFCGGDVSSTLIRTKLELGVDCSELSVECKQYIQSHSLYCNYQSMVTQLKARLTPSRFAHSVQVVLLAVRLNEQLGLDYNSVFTAALLHDYSKYSTRSHPEIPEALSTGPIAHAFVGALEIQTDFALRDSDIINAVRYHTTGRAGMSKLERLIYLSDYAEETRTHPTAARVRALALQNFEEGFLAAVEAMHDFLGEGEDICPLSLECYNYYVKK